MKAYCSSDTNIKRKEEKKYICFTCNSFIFNTIEKQKQKLYIQPTKT